MSDVPTSGDSDLTGQIAEHTGRLLKQSRELIATLDDQLTRGDAGDSADPA